MIIQTGLFEHMVVQRNSRNLSEAAFRGDCQSQGALVARVTHQGRAVKGLDGVKVGSAKGGRFSGVLAGAPMGGPYDVELCIDGSDERVKVRDVLVGDVWILAGQSNMEGAGLLAHAARPHGMVRAFFMTDQWGVAQDKLHDLSKAVDAVHADLCGGNLPQFNPHLGAGPGVSFGQQMYHYTNVPQGLLACAHGGTSMSQWDPKLKKLGSRSLYGAMMRRFVKNGGKVAGVAWYQGCSDANADAVKLFTKRMKELVAAMRRDLGKADLPIVTVQISRVVGWGAAEAAWNSIQDQQRLFVNLVKNCAVVPAIDLELEDPIHVSGVDQNRLGRRMARAMMSLTTPGDKIKPPISLGKITLRQNPRTSQGEVVMEFDNVVGGLQASGRPTGFSLSNSAGNTPGIWRVELEANKVILRTSFLPMDLNDKSLWYGKGFEPYCNITDQADQSLPVLGPILLGRPRAMSPFVTRMRISGLLPSAGNLASLQYPAAGSLKLQDKTFAQPFCHRHEEFAARGKEDVLVYYACRLRCAEAMKLKAHLGYDGPIKIWFDGREVYKDPEGTNPALPGDAVLSVPAKAGEHELMIALGSNCGRAWGVFLRLERTDVPLSAIKKGPENYTMPEVV